MIKIEDYILRSKTDRQIHLKLDEACIERGGKSTFFKGLLAHVLDTTIPAGFKILLCHACHNEKCSNPNHLYWGSAKENVQDRLDNGGKTAWEYSVEKYGLEGAMAINRRKKNTNGKGNKGKTKSDEHKRKISEAIKAKHRERNAGMAELVDALDSKSSS